MREKFKLPDPFSSIDMEIYHHKKGDSKKNLIFGEFSTSIKKLTKNFERVS